MILRILLLIWKPKWLDFQKFKHTKCICKKLGLMTFTMDKSTPKNPKISKGSCKEHWIGI